MSNMVLLTFESSANDMSILPKLLLSGHGRLWNNAHQNAVAELMGHPVENWQQGNQPEEVVDYCLLDGHAGLEQHGEVADLVGQLVAEDSDGGREAGDVALSEGGPDGHAVGHVVDSVPEDDHPSHGGDRLGLGHDVRVRVAVAVVGVLVLVDEHGLHCFLFLLLPDALL